MHLLHAGGEDPRRNHLVHGGGPDHGRPAPAHHRRELLRHVCAHVWELLRLEQPVCRALL